MAFDLGLIGMILGLIATVFGIYGSLKAVRTDWKLRQIREEEMMTNIEITEINTQKKSEGKKVMEGSAVFRNIGLMNLMIEQISIEFASKSDSLKLKFDSLKFANAKLKFVLKDKTQANPYIYFNLADILTIKSQTEEWGLYFDPQIQEATKDATVTIGNPYWLYGLQIASGEEFSEDYIIEYEGSGPVEVEITITSFKRTRKSLIEVKEWLNWWRADQAKYLEEAIKERKDLLEDPWKESMDRKIESFLIYLE
jgi:hypothetical protein